MSGYGPDGRPAGTEKDPVLRFLGGCALVFAGLAGIVVVGAFVVGWKLTRDEAPGRPEESILLGDETRYWCLDLRREDAGLAAVFETMIREAESARDEALKNSPLRILALDHRRNDLAKTLPLKIEIALAPSDSWSGRVTFSRGVFRMRAAVKLIRWIAGRDRKEAAVTEADGVEVTTFHDPRNGVSLSFATVGNRLLLAGDVERLRRALEAARAAPVLRDPAIDALHASVRLDGEDAWAFADGLAVASFDANEKDELAFRIAATPPVGREDGTMTATVALELARSFLPHLAEDAFQLGGPPVRRGDGRWLVEGRIPGLSGRLASAILRFSADRAERRSEPQTPSAIPSPPSPPPSSDPRSGTRAAPTREGSPNPAR